MPETLKELSWNSTESFQAAQPKRVRGIKRENQRMSYKRQLQAPSPVKPESNARHFGFIFFFPSPFPDSRHCSLGRAGLSAAIMAVSALGCLVCVCMCVHVCTRACACFLQSDWFVLSSAVVLVNGELNRYIQA